MKNRIIASLALILLGLCACDFESRRAVWKPAPGAIHKLRYTAELRAKADGSWASAQYISIAAAEFSVQAATDSAKEQVEISLTVDSLDFRSSERGPEEVEYMESLLRRYRARLTLSRTGQLLALEEQPRLPPVDFSPLDFGRHLAHALVSFPDAPIKKGGRWKILQPLLDEFHPEARIGKRFTLSAIRETPKGKLAICLAELEAFLGEEMEGGADSTKPSLTGRGQMVFNLDKGIPVSAELQLDGLFTTLPPRNPGDSGEPAPLPLRLEKRVKLEFSE